MAYALNRGLGTVCSCDAFNDPCIDGTPCDSSIVGPNVGGTSLPPLMSSSTSTVNSLATDLMVAPAVLALSPTSGQTFGQWVSTNSTFLLVAFGAVGALVALMRRGK